MCNKNPLKFLRQGMGGNVWEWWGMMENGWECRGMGG